MNAPKKIHLAVITTVIAACMCGCGTLDYLKGEKKGDRAVVSSLHERTFTNVLYILNPTEYRYELLIEESSPQFVRLITIEFFPSKNFVCTVVLDVGVNEKNWVYLQWVELGEGKVLVTEVTLHVKSESDVHKGSFPLIVGGN